MVLVSAALLFLVTFRNLSSLDTGFRSEDVLVANVFLSDQSHPREKQAAVQRDLTGRLAAIPGVASVAHASAPPLGGSACGTVVKIETTDGESKVETVCNQVSAFYFRVIQTPLVSGRDFDERDTPAATSLLYGVEPRDPWVLALIVGVLVGADLVAAVVPAHRALRTDPVLALRSE